MMKNSLYRVRISDNSPVKWIISLGSNLIGLFRGLKFSSVSLMDVLKSKNNFVALIFSWFGGMSNCSNHSRKKRDQTHKMASRMKL